MWFRLGSRTCAKGRPGRSGLPPRAFSCIRRAVILGSEAHSGLLRRGARRLSGEKGVTMRVFLCIGVLAAALAIPTLGLAASPPQAVMTGLDNPRGLAWGPEGGLYVAEAGRGGPGACVPLPDGPGLRCYGPTGAVSRLWHGNQTRVATGLPSLGGQLDGGTATGPQHVSFQGRGGLYVTIGCG